MPVSITAPESTAVTRTPILSRMIPAKIRKKMVPKALESQPRVDSIRSLIGDRMSMKMYAQNMAGASRDIHAVTFGEKCGRRGRKVIDRQEYLQKKAKFLPDIFGKTKNCSIFAV